MKWTIRRTIKTGILGGWPSTGHLTPATSQTFKSFISNMFHIMFHVTIKYQLRQQLPSGHEVMSQARLLPYENPLFSVHTFPKMWRPIPRLLCSDISLCNTCCFKKSQCMFGKTNSNAKSRCDRGKSVPPACGLGNQTFFRPSSFFGPTTFWKLLVEGFCNT